MGFFDRLKAGLAKTRQTLATGLAAVLKPGKLDGADAQALEAALLGADLGPELTQRLLAKLKGSDLSVAREGLRQAMLELAQGAGSSGAGLLQQAAAHPEVILVLGVNGSGKTTTCGKLAALWSKQSEKILLAGADTFRAAAVEQLRLWSERAGADFISQAPGTDPAAVAFDAVAKARAGGHDRLLIDTAGRLQTKTNLMEELRKIHRVCGRAMPGAPHRVLLVLDGTAGRNMLSQAKLFHEAVPLTGLVITKLDGTAKAGAVLSVIDELKIPVEMIGVGETVEDLQVFDPASFVDAMLGDA
ncbi:MAG: signal recognition particle-docking protein FtsY [candidate division FCPU426 bacterium]